MHFPIKKKKMCTFQPVLWQVNTLMWEFVSKPQHWGCRRLETWSKKSNERIMYDNSNYIGNLSLDPYYNGPGFLGKYDICVHIFSSRSFSPQKRFSTWILLGKQWEIHGPLKSIEIVVMTSVSFDQAFDAIAVHSEVIHLNFQDLKIAWHRYCKFSLEDCTFSASWLVP